MRRLIIYVLSPIVFFIAVVTVVPQFIDWNKFKPTVIEKVNTATGYNLVINGGLSVSVFPWPVISVSDVSLSAPGAEPVLRAERTDIAVKLLPLLKKQVHVTGLTVKSPVIHVIIDEKGNRNIISSAPDNKETAGTDTPSNTGAGFVLDKTVIEKGTFSHENRLLKTSHKVSDINTVLNAQSLQGPFSAAGDFNYNGDTLNFSAETGTVIAGNPASANISVKHRKSDTELQIAGDFTLKPSLTLKGSVSLTSVKSGNLMQTAEIPSAVMLLFDKGNLDFNAGVSLTKDEVSVTDVTLINSRTAISGKAKFSFAADNKRPSLSFDMVSDRLGWENVSSSGKSGSSAAKQAGSVADKLSGLLETSSGVLISPFSTGTDIDGKITIGTLTVPPYSARNAVMHIVGTDGRLQIKELKAVLPESTVLSASASLSPEDKVLSASFSVKSASANNFMRKIGKDISLPSDDLSVDGTIKLKPQTLEVTTLKIVNGKSSANGSFVFSKETKIPITLALETDGINIDGFLNGNKNKNAAETKSPAKTGGSFTDDLKDIKASFKISTRNTTYNNKNISAFRASGVLDNLYLDLTDVYMSQGDSTKLSAGGSIADISTLKSTDIDILIQSDNLSQFIKTFSSDFDNDNLKKANLKLTFIGDPEMTKIDFGGTVNGTAFRLHGNVKNPMKEPSFDLKASANHTELSRMIQDFAGYKPRGIGIGRFFTEASVSGSKGKFSISGLDIQIGDNQTIKGSLSYSSSDKGPTQINGKLTGTSINIGDLMPETPATKQTQQKTASASGKERWSRETVNLDFLRNLNGNITAKLGLIEYGKFILTDPSTDISFNNGTVTINNLETDLFGGRAGVKGNLAVGDKKSAHKGTFNITVKDTDVAKFFEALGQSTFSKGTLNYNQSLAFAGHSQKDFIGSLSGDGNMTVTDAILNGMDLNKLSQTLESPNSLSDFAKVFDTLTMGGTTPFDTITAPIAIRNGVVSSSDIMMKSNEVTVGITGAADLPNWTVNARGQINFIKRSNIPPLGMTITGSLDNPQKQIDKNIVANFAQQKLGNMLNKVINDKLGGNKNPAPAAPTPAPTKEPAASVPKPVAPTVQPVTPQSSGTAPAAKEQTPEQQLKDAGNQLLNNLLNGKR